MSSSRARLGQAGEAAAERFLQERGLKLLERNYRCRSGEIDLVMLDPNPSDTEVLCFIEVRLRGAGAFSDGLASVDEHKQRRLISAARHFLMERAQWQDHACRFDVVALDPKAPQPTWIQHAFETTG